VSEDVSSASSKWPCAARTEESQPQWDKALVLKMSGCGARGRAVVSVSRLIPFGIAGSERAAPRPNTKPAPYFAKEDLGRLMSKDKLTSNIADLTINSLAQFIRCA